MRRPHILRTLALTLVPAAGLLLWLGLGGADSPAGDPALGKTLYVKNCVVCHKIDGSGGMKLTGNPTPNWKDPKVWADPKRSDDSLRACITHGRVKSGMVAWGKQLKPEDIENLIAYIKTFRKKK